MTEVELNREVLRIDSAIRSHQWMDFSVWDYDGSTLSIAGSISESYPYDLMVVFTDVFCTSLLMSWKTDTSAVVFSLVSGDEEAELNRRFGVEQGNYWFRFQPEDFPKDFGCLIAAREVTLRPGKRVFDCAE